MASPAQHSDLLLAQQDVLQPTGLARHADQLELPTQRFRNRLRDNADTARIAEDVANARARAALTS
jgi:hypothetical protein